MIDEALGVLDHATELEAATQLIARRCRLPFERDTERQRAFELLVRRGFDTDVAYDAIRSAGSSAA